MSDKKTEKFTVVTSLNDLGEDFVNELISQPNDPNSGDETIKELPPEANPQAQAYYEVLKEQGLITEPEDFEFKGTFDQLKELSEYTYQQQYQLAQQQLMNQMPDQLRDVVQAGLSGVSDIDALLNMQKQINTKRFNLSNKFLT